MSPSRFLFDRSFDPDHEDPAPAEPVAAAPVPEPEEIPAPPEPPPPPLRHTDADLERARAEAHAAGRAAAEGEAATAAAEAADLRLAAALETVAARLDDAVAAASAVEATWTVAAARVATGIVRKLLPGLRRRFAAEDVLQIFKTVFDGAAEPASLTVVVAADLHEAVAERVAALAERQGYAGRLTVAADPDLAAGDCRITWPGGGAVRDQSALWADVEAAIATLADTADADAAHQQSLADAA